MQFRPVEGRAAERLHVPTPGLMRLALLPLAIVAAGGHVAVPHAQSSSRASLRVAGKAAGGSRGPLALNGSADAGLRLVRGSRAPLARYRLRAAHRRGHAGTTARTNHTGAEHATGNADVPPRGQLFFLFLTIDGLSFNDHWGAFFAGSDQRSWRIFMHCKNSAACAHRLAAGGTTLPMTQVGTVPTVYCDDLVGAMLQLLRAAVQASVSPNDKFTFLSESTLPLKPFQTVFNTVMSSRESAICTSTVDEWPEIRLTDFRKVLIVKHSQWVTLNHEHALTMLEYYTGARWPLAVWPDGELDGKGPLPEICLDEWAFFGTIYGTILDNGQQQQDDLWGFGDGPLQLRGPGAMKEQGTCHTFAFWDVDKANSTRKGLLEDLLDDWPHSDISCYPHCHGYHPAEFVKLSDNGVQALRRSPFLFGRKFKRDSVSAQQFKDFILPR